MPHRRRKTKTEKLCDAVIKAKMAWYDHIEIVKTAVRKAAPELADCDPHFSCSLSEDCLYVSVETGSPATEGQFGVRSGFDCFIPLHLIDNQDLTGIVRRIRKQRLLHQAR